MIAACCDGCCICDVYYFRWHRGVSVVSVALLTPEVAAPAGYDACLVECTRVIVAYGDGYGSIFGLQCYCFNRDCGSVF